MFIDSAQFDPRSEAARAANGGREAHSNCGLNQSADVTGGLVRKALRSVGVAVVLLFGVGFFGAESLVAQPPGTFPPPERLKSGDAEVDGASDGLPVEAFYLLDGSQKPAFIPSLTFKRYREIEAGSSAGSQLFAFRTLSIQGEAVENRCELNVGVEITVQPTEGRLIAIPLKMSNFHLLEDPRIEIGDQPPADTRNPENKPQESDNDQESSDDDDPESNSAAADSRSAGKGLYYLTVAPDEGGYLLWVRSDTQRSLKVELTMSARVGTGSTRNLDFRLPDAPSQIEITTPQPGQTGEIVGRGDEVIETSESDQTNTRFKIQSGGGRFSLRWGQANRTVESPLLEASSRVRMRWNSPQDQAILSIETDIRNLRGSVGSFQIRLPAGSSWLDTPQLSPSEQFVQIEESEQTASGTVWTITIPEEERSQEVSLSLDIQLEGENVSAGNPLLFRVPEVVGALRDQGEIQIDTSDDYRLRWQRPPYVYGIPGAVSSDGSSSRSYLFRYDRSTFTLKSWLSATQRQLRATSDTVVRFHDSIAELEMTIQFNGQARDDSSIRIDLAGWEYLSTVDADSVAQSGTDLEVDLRNNGSEAPPPFRIEAQRKLISPGGDVMMQLPRIIKTDDSLLVQRGELTLATGGRTSVIVDMARSTGLERVLDSDGGDSISGAIAELNRFRIVPPGESAWLSAKLVEQPPRIALQSEGEILLNGRSIETTMTWNLDSDSDLEGRLLVALPRSGAASRLGGDDRATRPIGRINEQSGADAGRVDATPGADVNSPEWTVFVENEIAVLRPYRSTENLDLAEPTDGQALDPDSSTSQLYELVSPLLSSGPHEIRWRCESKLGDRVQDDSEERVGCNVVVPRPMVDDTTLRGEIVFRLEGDDSNDLMLADTSNRSRISFQTFPREVLPIVVAAKNQGRQDLSIRKAVIRTAISETFRNEQIILQTSGGDSLTIRLPSDDTIARLLVTVDGVQTQPVRTQDQISIPLPPTDSDEPDKSHVIDIRIWVEGRFPRVTDGIHPIVTLPFGVQRTYWQVIVPADTHITWAAPSMGRAMSWTFDRWRLLRRPLHDDTALMSWVGDAAALPMPAGNRYLFVGSDTQGFLVRAASRSAMWVWVALVVIGGACVLTYFPKSRHPFATIILAVGFLGVLIAAPDTAVLLGQLALVGLVLVCLMLALRSLVFTQPSRVLTTTRPPMTSDGSTRTVVPSADPPVANDMRAVDIVTESLAATDPSSVSRTGSQPTETFHAVDGEGSRRDGRENKVGVTGATTSQVPASTQQSAAMVRSDDSDARTRSQGSGYSGALAEDSQVVPDSASGLTEGSSTQGPAAGEVSP